MGYVLNASIIIYFNNSPAAFGGGGIIIMICHVLSAFSVIAI
jgi:hypothetical protein